MGTLEFHDVLAYADSEEGAIAAYCKKWSILRLYKLANDFGDKKTHSNFYSVKTSQEEIALFSSPYVHNVVLVYDEGVPVNLPVIFEDTDEGRKLSGIVLLGEKGYVRFSYDRQEEVLGQKTIYKYHNATSKEVARKWLEAQNIEVHSYFLVVETPEGTIAKDIRGIFEQ